MSQVSDYTLSNIGFSAFRTELNSILGAVNTLNAGTSAPGSIAAGSLWLDTTSATTPTLKFMMVQIKFHFVLLTIQRIQLIG